MKRVAIPDLGPLAPFCQAIAALVVAELRPIIESNRAGDKVDRKSCDYSLRWWDRNAGVTFPVFKDGRRKVAKRADVDAAFERQAKFAPKTTPSAAPRDEDEAALVKAGIRVVGGR